MRRRNEEEHDSKERWLVSYADFITLLFAFFVVMYSISSVNEGKYKVLSQTLEGVFNASQRSITPIEVGDKVSYSSSQAEDNNINPIHIAPRGADSNVNTEVNTFQEITDKISSSLEVLISNGLVTVNENDQWIEISLDSGILFQSGDAEPVDDAFPVIEKIARTLSGAENAILVEGFTDNVPIKTRKYPTNWELSSARAATVVRMLQMEGVDPKRLAAIGYSEHQPIATNSSADGRRKNRRVVLLISRQNNVRASVRK
ncbi:flagellar motor protein MotD [Oleiphilus messinensis]|uniref:Flagellar motor protein MotD n=1 Tax=Oleiphilus messinensis TaxID=141451 RepID=A0A1Y0ICP6_9GAMM|nr:flagellar motor protein MotD [Oleiphilus messinensis]ARU57556.1 flagellar motor protein MotD [Oleiphilus messinensis]